jgi:thiamine kinase-like enzyme
VAYGGAYGLDLSFGGGIPADLDALFDQTKSLAARPRTITELPGGLTNRNYKVATPDGTFVARISSGGSELLAIDRDREYRNSVAAAAAGAGAPVAEYRPEHSLLVVGYIEGRTLGPADVARPANIPRIAAACRRLHSGARFGNDFDMFDIQRGYLSVARSRGFKIPAGYDDLLPQFTAAEKALAVRAGGPAYKGPAFEGTVPCNNDLLPANLIDDGERIWLIDYELSGNNDACFELGNIAAEAQLSPEALEHLVTAYYGRPRRSKIARAWLLGGLVGMYGWTLWGAIQNGASPIDYDFWSWAMERFEGAARGFTAASFPQLLEAVQEDD